MRTGIVQIRLSAGIEHAADGVQQGVDGVHADVQLGRVLSGSQPVLGNALRSCLVLPASHGVLPMRSQRARPAGLRSLGSNRLLPFCTYLNVVIEPCRHLE